MDSVVINCGIPELLTSLIANGKLMCLNNYFLTKKYKEESQAFKRLLILKNTEDCHMMSRNTWHGGTNPD